MTDQADYTKTSTLEPAYGDNIVGANGVLAIPIPQNKYPTGKTAIASDTNLVAANISNGVAIFGVTGSKLFGLTPDGFVFGSRINTGTTPGASGEILYYRVEVFVTTTISKLKVFAHVSTNMRAAIYSDALGPVPASLLVQSASTPVTLNQWNDISLSLAVTIGTWIWVALQSQASGTYSAFGQTGHKRELWSYGAFPATATPVDNPWGVAVGGFI